MEKGTRVPHRAARDSGTESDVVSLEVPIRLLYWYETHYGKMDFCRERRSRLVGAGQLVLPRKVGWRSVPVEYFE